MVSQGSCKRELPAFEHSDWLGLSAWPVVAHVQELLPSGCLDVGASDFRNFLDCARPAQALNPGLRLIGDSEECDVGLPLGGSTSCGGSSLPASSSASSISSCAGHASGRAGRLLRQSPSSSAEEVLALASSAMCASSSSGCSVLGIVGDSEEELWIETASFASSSAIAASVTAREDSDCPSCASCSSFSGSRSETERTSGVEFGRGQ